MLYNDFNEKLLGLQGVRIKNIESDETNINNGFRYGYLKLIKFN